jgi:predicted phage terminase large subunit-like protein
MSLKQKQIKAEKIKRAGKGNFYFFCKNILGYSKMEPKPHQDLCDFIVKSKKRKKLILLPRGSFKSSVVTIGYSLHTLINDPDKRVLISSETFTQSKAFLKGIKTHIEQNNRLKTLYGDLKGEDGVWRQEEITISTRTNTVSKEPSVSCSGVGQTRVGMHYNVIILDDVVSNNNINTPEQIQKIINHYKLLLSILEPDGELIIVGTRYSYADLYGHIIEEEPKEFDIYRKAAIDEKGDLLFPQVLTKKFLISQKRAQGSSHFANQYLNQPIDEDSAIFKTKWIKFYEQLPKNLRPFMCIDMASTDNKKSDFTAIVICGIDAYNNIFVIEAIQLKQSIAEIVHLVFKKVAEYNINNEGTVGLETNANQQTYKYIFSEEMNKRDFYFPITELKPKTNRTKISRVSALQPWFENGKIMLKKDQKDLYDQIIRFPRTKNDDLIDALAYILEIMSPGAKVEVDKWADSKLSLTEINIWKHKEDLCKKRLVRKTKHRF